uniref:Putative capsid protein n=1 Tax=viral metagenome TaxID=1070528 RepID=A0A6M3KK16_9ZZZZ
MAFSLAEFAKIEKDTLRKSVLDTLVMEIVMGDAIPWETIGKMSTTVVRYQDLPSIGFRKLNEGYAEGAGHLEQSVENIALMGVYLDTDKVLARSKNTIADARAIQQTMGLKGMAYKFNDKFFNGNPLSDPEEFKGLSKRIDDLYTEGFTGQYIDNAGTAGDGILLSSTERHNFLDHLDQLIYAIKGHKPDALYMNSDCLLALRSLLRREQLLMTTKDQFDRVVDMYGSIPMKDVGVGADQITEIITSTETLEDAGAAESTSIYAVRYGIGEFMWGIQVYPLETDDKGLLDDKPVYRTEVDWPLGLAIADPYSVARLYAIIPNAST